MMTRVPVAALYVETNGVYFGIEGVDPWDEKRDARRYDGPYPVVAHPPCARWCRMAGLMEYLHGLPVGDDGGTFEAALSAVRRFGGVLEHPAHSLAWAEYGLPEPFRGYWQATFCGGWVTEVSQSAYGHSMTKETWLYCVGEPLPLDYSSPPATGQIGYPSAVRRLQGRSDIPQVPKRERSATPVAFRDVLLDIARASAMVAA
jgi:hypothetical protein